jgi:hypothetical protein
MKKFLILLFVFSSCARIPVQVVELSDALKEEGERMHQLNLALVNKLFFEKRHMINEVIEKEYTPRFIENFKSVLPDDVDFEADFNELAQAVYPRINATRDSLIAVLEAQKNTIVGKLNTDYKVYADAFDEMQNLLRSASRLSRQRTEVFQQIKSLTGNKIDVEGIENALNRFIKGAGQIAGRADALSNTISSLLK